MIQARNKLSQEELSEAKKLINCCQNYDGTYRDPYLSNMLNFDPNMPAFFLQLHEWLVHPFAHALEQS